MKASKAIELLEPIPEDDFIVGRFTDYIDKCCVIGHLSRLVSANPDDYSADNCSDGRRVRHGLEDRMEIPAPGKEGVFDLRITSRKFIQSTYPEYADDFNAEISGVNNDDGINGYNEPVIKDRVMHLLRDMDAAGY